jgi:hypothetical protein
MSLKDEIENLIKAERDKLETLDQKSREFYERQRQRFIPMRVIIEEISKSVEPEYIRVLIHESDAEIKLGRRNSIGHFEEDIRWQIEPNYEWQPFQNGKEEFGVSRRIRGVVSTLFTHCLHAFNFSGAPLQMQIAKL